MGKKTIILFFIIISLISMILSLAPFTPAILCSFCMIIISTIYALNSYFKIWIILYLINIIAVPNSPITGIFLIELDNI